MKQMLFLILIAGLLTLAGCPRADKKKPVAEEEEEGTTNTVAAKKTAIPAGTGTITGKIVLVGDVPAACKTPIAELLKNPDCTNPDKCKLPAGKDWLNYDTSWVVKDKAVANVLVSLAVPKNSYFEPSESDKVRSDTVEIDQPCCAFSPRVEVLYPAYFDGKGLQKTGQKFVVKNPDKFPHNFSYVGDEFSGNNGNPFIDPQSEKVISIKPQPPQLGPIAVACSIHTFMKAKVFALDHPYAMVTGEDGKFTLKNVPNDTKLTIDFWHEAKGKWTTKEVTVGKGETKDLGEITISVN